MTMVSHSLLKNRSHLKYKAGLNVKFANLALCLNRLEFHLTYWESFFFLVISLKTSFKKEKKITSSSTLTGHIFELVYVNSILRVKLLCQHLLLKIKLFL